MYYIYKFSKDEEVLYIGKSSVLYLSRARDHIKSFRKHYLDSNKLEFIMVESENDMNFLEALLIMHYNPKHNSVVGNLFKSVGIKINFEKLPFIEYEEFKREYDLVLENQRLTTKLVNKDMQIIDLKERIKNLEKRRKND